MKQIKLEVGKTYRNRKGEEVKIVWNDYTDTYPYLGSDGEWFTESGRVDLDFEEAAQDLIEEVPSETIRHTFAIPDGVKGINVSKEGNRIVVEMVPEAKGPKPGDVMINDNGNVYIFKDDVEDSYNHFHYAGIGRSGRLSIGWICKLGRPATPEEAQPLFDALKKAGKRWNAETMQVEDLPEIYRIRKWVEENLKTAHYSHAHLSMAINGYLKYREGEK